MNIFRERIFWTGVAVLALILILPLILPDPPDKNWRQRKFWIEKTHGKKTFDIVIGGDSRIYRAVSPSHMNEVLKDKTIINMGYPAAGFRQPLFETLERRLSKEEDQPIIILGITPRSLTETAAKNEELVQELKRGWGEIFSASRLEKYRPFFASRISVQSLTEAKNAAIFHEEFHSTGWVATWVDKAGFAESQLQQYIDIFQNEKVSVPVARELITAVNEWSKKGYKVFGFFPPTSEKMVEIENSASGLNRKVLAENFTAAGGIWIEIESKERYFTYDGEHMDKNTAIIFSKDLASFIKNFSGQ